LNDVEEGGHTAFPQAKLPDSPDTYARNACNGEGGIRVAPKKGNAVMWYNMLEDGNGDKDALHEACPVLKGEKWGMNLWFWDPQRDDDGLH
jgi:prolyl 4-hydroxylase